MAAMGPEAICIVVPKHYYAPSKINMLALVAIFRNGTVRKSNVLKRWGNFELDDQASNHLVGGSNPSGRAI